ncbi:MAG: efflux RND transporter permease subunit [Spirochaetia bacterium]|nr:efflux RND transporter permease subunit [Spirochaetia bacterium]
MNDNFRNFRLKLIFLALCILILLAIKGHVNLGYAPELEKKSISVAFDYYGSFEKDVEVLVSRLEDAYMELNGLKSIHSVSEPGRGYIVCQFSDKTRLEDAYVQISDITAGAWSDFPEGVNRPTITSSSRDASPIYISYFPQEKENEADLIKAAYDAVPGVGEVELGGRKRRELMLNLHSHRLAGMSLPGASLGSKLRSSNLARKVDMPGGQTLVLSSRLSSASDFGQVQMTPGLRLSDVADIEYRDAEDRSLGRIDGRSMLLFFIMKSGEGNTVRLCRQLEKVTSQFGGSRLYSLGNKIEKSFIGSSSILLLLFIFLLFGQWFKTRNIHLATQAICRCIGALLVSAASVTAAGFQVDMTVMTSLSLVIIFSFAEDGTKNHNYLPKPYEEPINSQDIAVLRSIGRKSINDFTGEDMEKSGKWAYKFWQQLGIKSPFFRRWFGDWREADTSRVEAMLKINIIDVQNKDEAVKYIENNLSKRIFFRGDDKINTDTGFKIIIAKKVYEDTLTYANREYSRTKNFDDYLARLSILPHIVEVVEKSILLDTQTIGNDKNIYRSFIHKFYIVSKINNKDYIIKLAVDELDTEGNETKRAYNVDNIKISPIAVSRFFNSADTMGDFGSSTSTYTVADLHALVKQYDRDFHPLPPQKTNPNICLEQSFAFPAISILATLIIVLYTPICFRNLILPFCISLSAGCCASFVFQFFMKENFSRRIPIPIWAYSPILLFILVLAPFSPVSPFASDVSFSMEFDSGTSFSFIRQSALDVETDLLRWNAFDRLILHVDQGRASFTVIGGRKRDIIAKITDISAKYPEIFFYMPEKHAKNAIDVTVYGNDVSEIKNNILNLAKYVNKGDNNVNIVYNFKSDVQNTVLEIPVKCVSACFYPYDVYKTLYYTASEPVIDKYFEVDVETDVKVGGDIRYRDTLSGLLSVPILSSYGMAGEAGDYIAVRKEMAQGRICHRNRMRCLSFSVTGLSRSRLRKIVSDFPFSDSCHGEVCF